MPAFGRLAIKDPVTGRWLSNLNRGGTRVRYRRIDGRMVWVRMTINNTKVRNPNYDAKKPDPKEPAWVKCV